MDASYPGLQPARPHHTREEAAQGALETVAGGGPLASVLEFLCRTMEEQSLDRVVACIHPVNEDATVFCDAVAPSLDKSYRENVDGVVVSSLVGPCCHAVTTRQVVVIPDVAADPKWAWFQQFAGPLGIRSCWSTPIFSSQGKVLGTFAHYYFEVRDPSPRDERMVELLTRAAAIAIERSRAEAALREMNETLEQRVHSETRERLQIWNVSQDLLAIADLEGRYINLNPAWTETLGWSEEDLVGESFRSLLHPDDLERSDEEFDQLVRGCKMLRFENRVRAKDGSYHWISWNAAPDGGRIYGMGRDITEHKLAEQALREREREVSQILETIPGLVAILTPTGDVQGVNHELVEYCGQPLEAMKEWGTNGTMHSEDLPRIVPLFMEAIGSGQPYDFEARIRRFDGLYRWCQVRGLPLRDANGRIVRWYVVLSDIDDRKHAEDAIDELRSELAHVARATTLSALTASIAHEVNQPLSGIITNAGTCLRMLDTNPPNVDGARETARRTIRDGNRASDVIRRLRALFSRGELTLESLDLNEAAREVIALSSSDLQRNRIVLQSELAGDLPAVNGDRIQLQQVILNLLRNASDAMADVQDRPRELLIRTEREGGERVRLMVRDAGTGLSPETYDSLFDAFYTTKSAGMGIGLFVSRSIIELHHGRLWAEPNTDAPGATFSFSIPGTHAALHA